MPEKIIETVLSEVLSGDSQSSALLFINYLKSNEMQFERGTGYWENQLYWLIKYKNEYVCFILVNGFGAEEKFSPFTIWADDSGSNWFEDDSIDDRMKEVAWRNIDFCEHCGSCGGGTYKTVFGKEFADVCRTTMRFVNPDGETLEFVKKMIEMRKNDILNKIKQKK